MKVRIALLAVLLGCSLETSASDDFPCPDERSRELYARLQELNALHPLSRAVPEYSELIKQASKRQMDNFIFHAACYELAYRTFRTKCTDYGYECLSPASGFLDWPAQMSDWIPELKKNVAALESCPDAAIHRDPKLPIVRFHPDIPREVIDEKITGWVFLTLDLDASGKVANAQVTSSTSSKLEAPALEAARKFRYQNKRKWPIKGVSATVPINYLTLAEAAGCSMSYELRVLR